MLWLLGQIITETITLNSTQESSPRKQDKSGSLEFFTCFQITYLLFICVQTLCILTEGFYSATEEL